MNIRQPPSSARDVATLKALALACWEAELSRELAQLQNHFAAWAAGAVTPFDLNEMLHQFHEGISRELYERYSAGTFEANVARGIALGLLPENALDSALRQRLSTQIEYFRTATHTENSEP